ncbi:helix-turn-helix transcriptional regulator [Leptolyngbya sp. FACHB-36]|nr:helix-turn-helix transcriptional regulator [Leptolyngbya sp. FACHB-36]
MPRFTAHNTSKPASTQDLFKQYINSGTELSWGGIRLCRSVYQAPSDRVSNPRVPEHRISLHIAGDDYLERRLDRGKLLCTPTSPGMFNFVPAHREVESLWLNQVELLSIYLPPTLLEQTAIESCDRLPKEIELIDRFAIRDLFLEQLVHQLRTELEYGNSSDRLYIESIQTVLAGHLLRHHCSAKVVTASMSGGLSKSKLHQVIDYIENNLNHDINLTELARVAQVSPYHFGKLFKQTMGSTPHQYVLKRRTEQAKILLADAKLSLAEISQVLGFCDQSHFTNVFRRYMQLTPRQYRHKL